MNRRLFLRGLGGAAVLAPFLGSVVERAAKAQGVPVPPPPKRLIVMFTHYGCLTNRWFPASSHGPLIGADYMGTSLEALAPHAEKLLLPRGIRQMNQWTAAADTGQGNDPHTQVVGTYFTGVPVTPHTDDPFSFQEETKFLAMPTAPSLDHVCAQQLNPDGVPLYLRVGGRTENPQSAISYSAGETPFAGIGNLVEAFSSLTGLFVGGEPMSPDSYEAVRGKSILDLVKDDLETLERVDMSASDKMKLEAWKALLGEGGNMMTSAHCNEERAIALGLTQANLESPSTDITAMVTDGLDVADLYSNVAALTAVCNQNRVIFLKYPGTYTFTGLGISIESHTLSHRVANANMQGLCVEDANEMLMTIDRYYATKFAHLVKQLDELPEGEGTVLDNSATVWFQEMSDGNAHNLNNMPIIQAGSCGGYFKTGQAVNLHDGTSDLHRGDSEIVCSPEPSTVTNSGTPQEFGNAPINKYFCNLMNAIGVRAGEDGFPAVGGTREVTHYGRYDRTEDFASGGTLPPYIGDPGEFEALKAST